MEAVIYQDKPPIDELMHYGMPRRSGRYPYGSGDNPFQHAGDFLTRIEQLKQKGLSEKEIADGFKLTTKQLRTQKSLANYEIRSENVARAKALRDEGKSLNEITRIMGYKNDSSVRSLLDEDSERRMNQAMATADFIKERIKESGKIVDIGAGVERELGVSREKLDEAIYILELEGYQKLGGRREQVTNPGKFTTVKGIGPMDAQAKDIFDPNKVVSLRDYESHDGGETFDPKFVYPESMDSSRLKIRYAEDGGLQKDGLVEIRRGVEDLSLGESRYAQVRILVDGTHYIKGMAVYSDRPMPDGVDVIFNTNKPKGTDMKKVLKEIKKDPDNPFGSLIKEGIDDPDNPGSKRGGQRYYYDENGNKKLSLINKRAEEGDWGEWADKLPSQFLAKQSESLMKKQLKMSIDDKQAEYDDILSCTNPTVKKALLKSFSDDCDAAAEHLKAAALPRQKYQVIIPIPSLKDTEIYAPNYNDGEKVVLIRYPHGGTFEIPELTVNNKHVASKRVLGNTPIDAVGINSKVAERLSGADFDGDTVMVIPTNSKTKIISTPPLKGLKDFDPKMEYGGKPEGTFKQMRNTGNEMGKVSNLIMDMTLQGATDEELAKAVRHSMVVIDAEKHKLDYKQSEKDNDIAALKRKYQGRYDVDGKYRSGAATLLTRAKSPQDVNKRQGQPKINIKGKEWYDPSRPEGALIYKDSGETYVDRKTGKTVVRQQKSTKMMETDDAFTLVSTANTKAEQVYATYANKMKAMANEARKEYAATGKIDVSSEAKKIYANEVASLNSKLNTALKNAPRERQAQAIATSVVNAKIHDNPDMSKKEIKKEKQRALSAARNQVGAKRATINITEREWEAIQKGAIAESTLNKIINNADIDQVRKYAMPRSSNGLSPAKISRLKSLESRGYTNAQIANALGVSTSTVNNYLVGKE